jgi:hypothetical protein
MNGFIEWLSEKSGSFRGAPIPNYAILLGLLLLYSSFLITLIKYILKKLREKESKSEKQR